jgi:hypothetical protein
VDGGEKLDSFRRLNKFVEAVQTQMRPEADLRSLVAHEKALSPSLGGRSVGQKRRPPRLYPTSRQLSLF